MTLSERRAALIEEERLRKSGVKIEKPLAVCANCVYWIQHYVAGDPGRTIGYAPPFVPIPYGHCVCDCGRKYGQTKHKKAADTCDQFCTLKGMSEEELLKEMNREWKLV